MTRFSSCVPHLKLLNSLLYFMILFYVLSFLNLLPSKLFCSMSVAF